MTATLVDMETGYVTGLVNNGPVVRPDLSVFDAPCLGWSLSETNSLDNEPIFTATFAGTPTYKGETLETRKPILLETPGYSIDMLVRELSLDVEAGKVTTTVSLGSRKILLDQFIPGGFNIKTAGTKTSAVIQSLASKLGVTLKQIVVSPDAAEWPVKNSFLRGDENVLDYIQSATSLNKQPLYAIYLRADNSLYVQGRQGLNSPYDTFDYDRGRTFIQSLNLRVLDKYSEVEVMSAANMNDPKTQSKVVPATDFVLKGDTEVETKGTKKTRRSVTPADGFDHTQPSLSKAVSLTQSMVITLLGLHAFPPHSILKCKNMPLGNGSYVVNTVVYQERPGNPTTTLTLETKDAVAMILRGESQQGQKGGLPPKTQPSRPAVDFMGA